MEFGIWTPSVIGRLVVNEGCPGIVKLTGSRRSLPMMRSHTKCSDRDPGAWTPRITAEFECFAAAARLMLLS